MWAPSNSPVLHYEELIGTRLYKMTSQPRSAGHVPWQIPKLQKVDLLNSIPEIFGAAKCAVIGDDTTLLPYTLEQQNRWTAHSRINTVVHRDAQSWPTRSRTVLMAPCLVLPSRRDRQNTMGPSQTSSIAQTSSKVGTDTWPSIQLSPHDPP